jgi:pimeloyl-ACP methyl ester carboxylesterase
MNQLKSGILLITIFLTGAFSSAQSQTTPSQSETVDSVKTAAEAFKLINLPDPKFKPFQAPPMDSTQMADMGFEQVYKSEPSPFVMQDGKKLFAQTFSGSSNTTIILLHGILSSSYTMNRCAGLIREATEATVIALDLRGHGQSDGTPGDVDYIDQYADDVVDVIAAIKKNKPNGKIIIAGHSMGGGIALRYAMKKNAPLVDGYLLFSPLLGDNAPTIPKPTTTADTTSEPFMKIDIERIIGLYLYNTIGVHKYDSLPVLFFNLPVEMPLHKYTYRSSKSMSPADYVAGLKAVKAPLLVLVGSKDEAFVANEFKPAVENNSKGKVVVIEGASHNGIRHSKEAMNKVKMWFQNNYNAQ